MTTEDKIVYTGGTDHEQFASCSCCVIDTPLIARQKRSKVVPSSRVNGKAKRERIFKASACADASFWMVLDGEGRHPVMHFGMTGMIQVLHLATGPGGPN